MEAVWILLAGLVLLNLAVLAFAKTLRKRGISRMDWQLGLQAPILVAHRGSGSLFPENTLTAFCRSGEVYGCRFMELDVRCTADGVPVVLHDATVERTTNGSGAVSAMTLADLRQLDATAHFVPDADAPAPEIPLTPEPVPTLEAVLSALPECFFSVDIKQTRPRCEREVVDVIRRLGMEQRVILGSAEAACSRRIRALAPDIPSFFSRRAVRKLVLASWLGLGWTVRTPHHSLQIPERSGFIRIVTPRLLNLARRLDVPVLVWTPNATEAMHRLLSMGVDGLITDRPDRFNQVVEKLKLVSSGKIQSL